MNIYLCGFMGCGKSRIGRLLADKLGYRFADLDSYIEKAEGMTIPEIFEKHGEPHFRTLEAKYIKEMPAGSVVALGGGAIINPDTAKTARESGLTVFLDTPFNICYDRIKDDKHRPLVVKNTKEQLFDLFNFRSPIYAENSSVTVSGKGTPEKIAAEIIAKLPDQGG